MFLIKQMKKYRKNISIINQEECASIHIHTHSMESLDEYVLLLRLQKPYVLIGILSYDTQNILNLLFFMLS